MWRLWSFTSTQLKTGVAAQLITQAPELFALLTERLPGYLRPNVLGVHAVAELPVGFVWLTPELTKCHGLFLLNVQVAFLKGFAAAAANPYPGRLPGQRGQCLGRYGLAPKGADHRSC